MYRSENIIYLSIFIGEVNAQGAHGTNNSDQRLGSVTVDDRLELFVILACESTLMNDSVDIINIDVIIIIYYSLHLNQRNTEVEKIKQDE